MNERIPFQNAQPTHPPTLPTTPQPQVLEKAYIHKGKKRVRRSKLYYLWEKRDPKVYSLST